VTCWRRRRDDAGERGGGYTTSRIVGASLGGQTALLSEALLGGGRGLRACAGLILVDITPTMELAGVQRIVGWMLEKASEGFASLEEAAAAVKAYQPHRTRAVNLRTLRKNLRQRGADGRGTGTGIRASCPGTRPRRGAARRCASRPAMATAVTTTAGSRRTRSVRSRTRLRLPGSSSRRSRRKSTEARALHEAAVAVVHGVRRRAVGERRRMVLRERRAQTRCAFRGRV